MPSERWGLFHTPLYVEKQPRLRALRNETEWQSHNWLDRFVYQAREWFVRQWRKLRRFDDRQVDDIISRSERYAQLDESQLENKLRDVRINLRKQGLDDALVTEAFAVIREVSRRTLGMAHHHTQIRASLALLQGAIAEMATGEGKTLAATLGCATAAMAGLPVHVVTVNDYLAERDAEEMIPLYEALGLTVGIVIHERTLPERREAYACDICYCSNKELTFDYLKDRITLQGRESQHGLEVLNLTRDQSWQQQLLLRGLHFAIVDEADSVFIDESRTPLIISGNEDFGQREELLLTKAMSWAYKLEQDTHFYETPSAGYQLKDKGKTCLDEWAQDEGGLWRSVVYREPLIVQALNAIYRYKLDQDYIIDEEGCVQIVDPYTGRVMPGRSWGQGLQQMIEIKEQLELTKPRQTEAEISYQNFFRKYANLAGMTGTGSEVARELNNVYRLRSVNIPLLRTSLREYLPKEVYLTEQDKWQRVAEKVQECRAQGQAVLVGTASVSSSEAISELLNEQNIEHRVLNARQDSEEAEIVKQAGQTGSVMVATSMAGRGTDIKLSDETRNAGGLHVIITELQDSARVDRQLAGRAARQGDPGQVSEILSLEDSVVIKMADVWVKAAIKLAPRMGHRQRYWIVRYCQRQMEALHYRQRMDLIKQDEQRQKTLAFARRFLQSGA